MDKLKQAALVSALLAAGLVLAVKLLLEGVDWDAYDDAAYDEGLRSD